MKNPIIVDKDKVEFDSRFWSLAFTGHTNIEKCYGEIQTPFGCSYNCVIINGQGNDSANKLYRQIKKTIEKFINSNPNLTPRVIIGMARGVDEIAGLVAMDMDLDIVCCVPHSINWHQFREPTNKGRVQAIFYDRFLNYPKALWIEIKKTYSSGWHFANFARNAFMVDFANKVISFKCYDSTGTDHCIKYAKNENKYAGNITKE